VTDVGTIAFTSRDGSFTNSRTVLSATDTWQNYSLTPFTTDTMSEDYGIWKQNVTIKQYATNAGNYSVIYNGILSLANQPTSSPQAGTFRSYFPTSATVPVAPVKPIVAQNLSLAPGAVQPARNTTSLMTVQVVVYNPTAYPITFSASNLVTAYIPGVITGAGTVYYAGNPWVNMGTITAQPATGTPTTLTGTISWNPGTVPAGTTAIMNYNINVTPSTFGTRFVVTGTSTSNGTQAKYVDETCTNANPACTGTQLATATYTFGPLCELAVTSRGTALQPTLASITYIGAYNSGGRQIIEWETGSEVNTAGYYLYREVDSTGRLEQVNRLMVPALIENRQGGIYQVVDSGVAAGSTNRYVLLEVETRGKTRQHGPFEVKPVSRPFAAPFAGEFQRYSLREAASKADGGNGNGISGSKQVSVRPIPVPRTAGSQAKIFIEQGGMYSIDSAAIAGVFGINQTQALNLIKNAGLSLSSNGQTVSYLPDPANARIIFYGQGINSNFTKKNIYWLAKGRGDVMSSAAGRSVAQPASQPVVYLNPLHMDKVAVYDTPLEGDDPAEDNWHWEYVLSGIAGFETKAAGSIAQSSDQPASYPKNLHMEQNVIFDTSIAEDPAEDYWYWDYIYSGVDGYDTKAFNFPVSGLAAVRDNASVTVNLRGATDASTGNDHHAVIKLNGTIIGEKSWDGTGPVAVSIPVSQGLLREGSNSIEIRGLLDTGVPYSLFYINSFDVAYKRSFVAEGSSLAFTGGTEQTVTVTGFSGPGIKLFDVSDPLRPKVVSANVQGTSISFRPASADTKYLAAAEFPAAAYNGASPGVLKARGQRADYVIITTAELKAAADRLASYRRAQGYQTMVVLVEDIMNDFNYGIYDPQAIKSFIRYARDNWTKAPAYIVLAGSGTLDYRDNMGLGDQQVPPVMVPTPSGLAASDNSYVDLAGDHKPEIAIGRLPAATLADLGAMVNKIIAYENGATGPWATNALLAADIPDEGGDFSGDIDQIAPLIPTRITSGELKLADVDIDTANATLMSGINSGLLFVDYIGHGGVTQLSRDGLLKQSDVDNMTNGSKLSVLTAMTCMAAGYAFPGGVSIAESLILKQGGGMAAVWAPAGLSEDAYALMLNKAFYNAAFDGTGRTIGSIVLEAIRKSGIDADNAWMLDIYNLIGDPALRIKGIGSR
jgi:hypothetical protein